jgi:hypothetical protein
MMFEKQITLKQFIYNEVTLNEVTEQGWITMNTPHQLNYKTILNIQVHMV